MRLMAMSEQDLDAEARLMFLTVGDRKNSARYSETDYEDSC